MRNFRLKFSLRNVAICSSNSRNERPTCTGDDVQAVKGPCDVVDGAPLDSGDDDGVFIEGKRERKSSLINSDRRSSLNCAVNIQQPKLSSA